LWFYIFFTFVGNRRVSRRFWTEWQKALPEFDVLLICSSINFSISLLSSPNMYTVPHFLRRRLLLNMTGCLTVQRPTAVGQSVNVFLNRSNVRKTRLHCL
jgi:hypothetical protein